MVRRVLLHCAYFDMASSYRVDGGDTVFFFTDEEIARYLCGDRNVAHMVQMLQAARTRRPEASFDERVKEAWTSIRGQWTRDKT